MKILKNDPPKQCLKNSTSKLPLTQKGPIFLALTLESSI